ncbi:sugar ABC transporter permease [Paenibacillus sp. GP183]|jgi:raffinose/stachyose/melibiose transport system permease protein|uniref:carbohydrate ABC transporter permease n=1 Tax=Paenibacillus sp. GP183 TaxID=1882751 RepID=UPI000896597B|nr:sugar ABC transporter permease [Paenibacillus sp. GP183]SEC42438.1 raffinose/stachyose/melibiose transport system permease protein [Paenibacillus sp. GP183]
MTKTNKQTVILLAFVFPALVFYAVFVLAPAFGGVWYSLTDWNGLNRTYQMVGLSNYIEALKDDPIFLKSVWFTLKFVVFMVVLQNAIALSLAVLVESRKRSKVWFRTIFFMPNMMSLIIGGFMWLFIFTKVLPYIAEHSVFKFLDQSWIGDPKFSFFAILTVSLWGGVGYLMVIYIASLQGVPQHLKEAAAIDGANVFQIFRYVTLPMIFPALTIGIFLTLNGSFKAFDAVFSLTGGGPGRSTQVIALNIYEEAFKSSYRYGYANAKAMILFLVIFIITVIQLWIMKKREVES